MKKYKVMLAVILLIISFGAQAFACTGFAVYVKETLYGINFEYPYLEINYALDSKNDHKVFKMSFQYANGKTASTVGMNDKGLFASTQILNPIQALTTTKNDNEIEMGELAIKSLYDYDNVKAVEDFLNTTKVINQYETLHTMFADKTGNAMTVEAGKEGNRLTKIDGKYMIMTNFPETSIKGKTLHEIQGVGANRYKMADKMISDGFNTFDLDAAILTLLRTAQIDSQYSTQCSFVFRPEKNEVYLMLWREYDRVWKISMNDNTIETYKGFAENHKLTLDSKGVTLSQLRTYNKKPKLQLLKPETKTTKKTFFYFVAITLFSLLFSAYPIMSSVLNSFAISVGS